MPDSTFKETPVWESPNEIKKGDATLAHALIGVGLFFLLANLLPGGLMIPLLLIGGGTYLLRRKGMPLDWSEVGATFTKEHAAIGLGLVILAAQLLPGSLLLPALFIGAGLYLIRKQK